MTQGSCWQKKDCSRQDCFPIVGRAEVLNTQINVISFWGMERALMPCNFSGDDQKSPEGPVKIKFLGEIKTVIRLVTNPWFGGSA